MKKLLSIVYLLFSTLLCINSALGQAPTITNISPTEGPVGSLVTITGTNLGDLTALSIAGVTGLEISNDQSTLIGFVMPGATTGTVDVTTSFGSVSSSQSFTVNNPAATPALQLGADIDGEAASDESGSSVSISADGLRLAVGAPGNDGTDTDAGQVHIYEWSGSAWGQVGLDIDGEAAGDQSGWSVSLSADGHRVAIGALGNNGFTGHVRVYEDIAGVWTKIGDDIDGEAVSDQSGYSVSLSADGQRVAIGARLNGANVGHVRIYQDNAGVWTQIGLDIDGENTNDQSAFSVSLSANGQRVAIGAPFNAGNGSRAGHVRIFEDIAGTWTQVGVDINGEAVNEEYGWSVSLSADGQRVAIGATAVLTGSAGYVRIYEWSGSVWNKIADIDGEVPDDRSGISVSLSADGNRVAIGARLNAGGGLDAGHVRIYEDIAGTWSQILDDIDGEAAGNESGRSVSLSADGERLAIGAPFNNGNGVSAGHVRAFQLVNPLNLITSTPTSNANNVATNSNIVLNFDLNVDGTTANATNIVVSGNLSGLIDGTFLGGGTSTITFTPSNSFKPAEIISVTVTAGLLGTGAEIAVAKTFQFTVASQTGPGTFLPAGNLILGGISGGRGLKAVDLDGDGDIDFLSASYFADEIAWLENDGSQNFTKRVIGTGFQVDQASDLFAADFDGDGDLDIVSVSTTDFGRVNWWENDGSQNFSTNFVTAFSMEDPGVVIAADMDRDGDMDIVLGTSIPAPQRIRWYENTGPFFAAGRDVLSGIETVNFVSGLFATDMDNDGDMDLLSSSFLDDKIAWYENDGNEYFTQRVITTTASRANDVYAADIDSDGDVDIFTTGFLDNTVYWFENNGSQSFTERTLTTKNGPSSVVVTDVDGDGDMDVVTSAQDDNTVTFLINDGSQNFTEQAITSTANTPNTVTPVDMDQDGDLDIVIYNQAGTEILWYEQAVIAPITQASNLSFSNVTSSSLTLDWTNGDGANRIVVARAGSPVDANPSDNTTYNANTIFGDGDLVGTGNFVVYNGSGNSFTVTGLTAGQTYHFSVFEYNGATGGEKFNTATAINNPASKWIGRPFITTWSTTDGNITIPTTGTGYNYDIKWTNLTSTGVGDGLASGIGNTPYLISGLAPNETYQIEISGTFPRIYFFNGSEKDKIQTVEQWGDIVWSPTMTFTFLGCTALTIPAVDAPDLSNVTNMTGFFNGASAFNSDISNWDLSNVNFMGGFFQNATAFNNGGQPLTWGSSVSNVSNMNSLFSGAISFNQDISDWDVSSVENMSSMFFNASLFNQDISDWDVSEVLDMSFIFANASNFNNGSQALNWGVKTAKVQNMARMFENAAQFDQAIGDWNVSQVTDMSSMFSGASSFNQDISSWEVSEVQNMSQMFITASNFNQNIGGWDVSKVENMSLMFFSATEFNNGDAPLLWNSNGGTSAVINMASMFSNAINFNQAISTWNVSSATNMSGMFFRAGSFNQNIGGWDVTSVTDMSNMFRDASNFNNGGSALLWNTNGGTGAVTNMFRMFHNTSGFYSFNQDIGTWDVSSVTNMSQMFYNNNFNQNIGGWDVTSVTDMSRMFNSASAFNNGGAPLLWNLNGGTAAVTDMSSMFSSATSFNQNVSTWDVSSVNNMYRMFLNSLAFDQSLAAWDVSAVVSISSTDGMNNMLYRSGLSTANYDATLEGWSSLPLQNNITLDARDIFYCSPSAAAARADIIANFGWTFDDGGICEPSSQASNITFSNIGVNQMDINWTSGNGSDRIVIVRDSAPVNAIPSDANSYTANAAFGDGATEIGTDNFVVYNGTGNSITITNLVGGTDYHVSVFEYNGTTGNENYISTGSINSQSTLATQPTAQASSINFTNLAASELEISWMNGNGSNRIVLVKAGAPVDAVPANATAYNANSVLGSGDDLGTGNFVVYNGNSNNFTLSGLNASTTYHVQVFEYNGTSGTESYNISALSGNPANQSTLATQPTNQVSNIAFTNLSTTQMDVGWDIGNGTNRIVVVKVGAPVDATPANASTYNANSAFGLGDELATGNFVVYNGTGNTFTLTNLTFGTEYHVRVFEYNGTSGTENYNVNIGVMGNPTNIFLGPEIQVLNEPTNLTSTDLVDFGSALINQSSSETFTITNQGSIDLIISDMQLTAGTAYSISGITLPATINAGGTTNFTITLSSAIPQQWDDILTISNNDANETNFVINLSGTITATAEPEIELLAGTIPFSTGSTITLADAVQSNEATQIFTINNIGTAELTINSANFNDGSAFSVSSISSPIAAGSSANFTVTLDGTLAGDFSDVLTIFSNDADESSFVINLSGTVIGISEPEIEVINASTVLVSGSSVIDFGQGTVGSNVQQQLVINNLGTTDLNISSLTLRGDSNFSVSPATAVVPAGGTASFSLTLSTAAAGSFTDQLTINSDDPDEGAFIIDLQGIIVAADGQEISVIYDGSPLISGTGLIDFGEVIQGQTASQTLTIENTGTSELVITEILLDDGSAFSFEELDFPLTLMPEESLAITLLLSTDVVGFFTDTMTIVSNDPDLGGFEIDLSGNVNPVPVPRLEVRDSAGLVGKVVQFGTTEENNGLSLSFNIFNLGTAELQISNIGSTSGQFTVSGITLPISIAASTSASFNLTFSADQVGEFESTISISSNDPGQEVFSFNVRAVISGGQAVVFITNEDNTVDRFVISNEDIDLGQTLVDLDIVKIFGIENLSESETLQINGITTDNPLFTVSDIPASVAAGGLEEFSLTLNSRRVGINSAQITISTSINDFSFNAVAEVIAEEEPQLTVYNVITPNGDGRHDFLFIENIDLYPNSSLSIYNRWGNKVFEIDRYDNTGNIFEGISDSGEELLTGNYYYVIDRGDGSGRFSGFILIKR
ncbi:gliding motility-associated C-terminal domain-containing protein [Marivirga sericea]|uniref:Gliding motility-associated C-terminal domain-containing protein n=1 Tax=Marivirga sericea TaxID=1028 RepID=A0A1X7LHT7_9BACT|nr:BspA family leucine-rich repeat surface protein [Marivirga sericea]SMG52832.1 gliding motility-associated C-terminal domain-containing protein [Marivirga sericea]